MSGRAPLICGIDVGSTTCKYVLAAPDGTVLSREYVRHHGRQAEMVRRFLGSLEREHGFAPRQDRLLLTGSGAGVIAPLVGGRVVQEVVALAAAIEPRHLAVRFVSEIGGEDMKTVFLQGADDRRTRQAYMQSACSGGTGAFVERAARKLGLTLDALGGLDCAGEPLHRISSKCGIFAETDVNTLLKAGVAAPEIVASLFDAVVQQNLATMTKGNTPMPEVLLLGGPNLFFRGLQLAWRRRLGEIWRDRGVPVPPDATETLVRVPEDAVYYPAIGCIELARQDPDAAGSYAGVARLGEWLGVGQREQKRREGGPGLCASREEVDALEARYGQATRPPAPRPIPARGSVIVGCDFGSATAKAVCLTAEGDVVFSCYGLSRGNPIEDARALFRELYGAVGHLELGALAVTGYGKDLLQSILGADCPVVETVAHAAAGLHLFPDTDCICDVGGTDIKIMLLRHGVVSDFRLNSQCSSGNGTFLHTLGERFEIPLGEIADRALSARAMPRLTMGCGVFLQSSIVSYLRNGWQAEEILAGLCSVIPLNVWLYAGGLNNLAQAGRTFVLQGGTHRNLAVVKAQVDFIRSKVPEAEVVVHPYAAEAGALGAALLGREWWQRGGRAQFRGYDTIERLRYHATTSADTLCPWCTLHCQRTFIDVELPGGPGRPWSTVPLPEGWERVIVGNSCPRGLVEDPKEVRTVKDEMEKMRHAFPNAGLVARQDAFRVSA